MYFALRNDTIYVRLASLSRTQRLLLTLGSITAVWSVWGYGVYIKNMQNIARCREDIVTLRAQHTRSIRIARDSALCQKTIHDLQNVLHDYGGGTVAGKTIVQTYLIDIMQLIKKSGLYLVGCSEGACIDKGWYTKRTLQINMTGTLPALQHFFSYLKNIKALIKCSHVRINHDTGEIFSVSLDFHVALLTQKSEIKKSLQLETS